MQLTYSQCGATDGSVVIYFHGAPGAPEEFRIFDSDAKRNGLTFICLDRFSINPPITGEAYFKILAAEISRIAKGQKVDFVGFSIGAFVAVQVLRYMGDDVRSLHLVSAAAPLEANNYLDAMAGKHVFKIALSYPGLFVLLS